MAGGLPGVFSLQDYLDTFQGLSPDAAALSDVPGGAGALSSLAGGAGDLSSLFGDIAPFAAGAADIMNFLSGDPGKIAGTIALGPLGGLLGGLLEGAFTGRSSTGPGSATADIAGAAGNADPVIALLGKGAGALGGNTPVSSPSAGPTYGPYFDVARKLEDLLRWGPGGLSDPKAEALDATTLKNAMTQLGNPGKAGTSTLDALEQTYKGGSQNLTPANIQLLMNQMDPTEQGILKSIIGGSTTGGTPTGGSTTVGPMLTGGGSGGQSGGLPTQQILQRAMLARLLGGGGGFQFGWS